MMHGQKNIKTGYRIISSTNFNARSKKHQKRLQKFKVEAEG